MTTSKRVISLRAEDKAFDKIGVFATGEHRSVINYIEYTFLKHLSEVEHEKGAILKRN